MPPIVGPPTIGANHNLPPKTAFARDCVVTLRSPLESRLPSAHSRRVEHEHLQPDDASPPSGTDLSGGHDPSGGADVPSAASLPPPFPTEGVAAPSRPGEVPPPAPQCLAASVPSCPPPRNILAVLSNIDHVNSTLGAHKLKASEALLELALDKDHDKVERRKCATAILRAPFQRYPSAAAINGPTPPKPKRRKNDDDDDRDGGDGGDDPPPSAPEDLMRAYDHGYWNGYATFPWEKATRDTIEETVENYAAHAPGRKTPLPSGPDRIAPDRSKPGVITPPGAITPPLAPSGASDANHSQAPVASTLKEAPAQAGVHAAQPHHSSPRATTRPSTSPKRQRVGSTRTQHGSVPPIVGAPTIGANHNPHPRPPPPLTSPVSRPLHSSAGPGRCRPCGPSRGCRCRCTGCGGSVSSTHPARARHRA